jgi:hypothetical protein
MLLTKLSLGRIYLIIPGQGEFGKRHPGQLGTGKSLTFFYSVLPCFPLYIILTAIQQGSIFSLSMSSQAWILHSTCHRACQLIVNGLRDTLVCKFRPVSPLKGHCHEIFCSCFFHESVSPQPQSIPLGQLRIFSKIRGDIRSSRLTTGVIDTGGKSKKSSTRKFLIIFLDTYG